MAKTLLPPGFRFHPTDVELIKFYLTRKVMGKRICFDVISEIDVYKFCPWDLPEKSCLRSKDLEWYFFCPRERKYSNGARMNRATQYGYWKTTGKDRSVLYNGQVVGMIKTLIFHRGKAPRGDRTDWVMHEYRLEDKALVDDGIVQDAFVICKIFQKSGPGPKNGAQYGAPFNEQEWSDNEVDGIESFSLVNLSGPPPTLQNNPSNSAPTSTFIPATIWVGSSSETTPSKTVQCSSETTPSKTVQCPDNMLLPLPEYDVSMLDITLPPDDILSSLMACLTDDTTVVYNNHEQNEILVNVNHHDIIPATSLDVNNMYDNLEEIVKWCDLPEYHSINGCEANFSNNQMLGCEDLFYLEDLECPLEGPSKMKEPECIPTGTGPSHFNFYNSPELPCYLFNSSDADAHAPSTSRTRLSLVPVESYWYENNGQDDGVKEETPSKCIRNMRLL